MPYKEMTEERREKQRIANRRHYAENKQYYLDKSKARNKLMKAASRAFITAYLEQHPCVDCGNTDVRVLDFDHVRGTKLFNISAAAGRKRHVSQAMLEAEIAKCEVRCANCHRIVTHERRLLRRRPATTGAASEPR